MEFNEYQKQAIVTKKPWDSKEWELVYCCLGLTGESGEVTDMVKKHISGTKLLEGEQLEKIKYEIGDVMWYIAALCDGLGLDMGELAQMNIDKLRKRHGTSFSGFGNRSGEKK